MSISDLETKIRDRINSARKQNELLDRTADWNRLCSSLDIVGDTELALDSYLNLSAVDDIGLCYLHVYGALQLLQSQQDAVSHICQSLKIKVENSPKIPHIREIRSSAVAHQAAEKSNKITKSSFLVRSSLNHFGFNLMTVYSDDTPYSQKTIKIPTLVKEQREYLYKVLEEVIKTMDEAEMKHRKKHREEKLQDAFPPTLSYYFSKVFEAIHSSTYFPLGEMHVDLISECLTKLENLLRTRNEWGIFNSVDYQYELLKYPLLELKSFFSSENESKLNSKDAYIFCSFVHEQIKNLQQIAVEIDEKYAEDIK